MDGTRQVVDEVSEAYLEAQGQACDELREELLAIVRGVRDMVKAHPARVRLPMDRVKEIFEAHLEGVQQACAAHQQELQHELRNIHLDMIQHSGSSFFTQAMAGAYEKSKTDSGPGIKARTFNTFETHLGLDGKRSPFAVICEKFTKAISKDVTDKNKPLAHKIDRVFRDLYTQFDDMVDQKMDDEREEEVRRSSGCIFVELSATLTVSKEILHASRRSTSLPWR